MTSKAETTARIPLRPPNSAEKAQIRADLRKEAGGIVDDAKLAFVPSSWQIQYLRVLLGKAGRATAIKMHCRECMGWTQDPCDNRNCCLWRVRWGAK
jgi:hypothetical protein